MFLNSTVLIDDCLTITDSQISELKSKIYNVEIIITKFNVYDVANIKRKSSRLVILTTDKLISSEFPNNTIIVENNTITDKIIKSVIYLIMSANRNNYDFEHTFFISDTHFNHKNIILPSYCNRPWNSGIDENGETIVTKEDVQRMNEDIISNWNKTVSNDDIVWHLGDFALGNRNEIKNIVSRLNGHKYIVLGNHDIFKFDKTQYRDIVDFFYKVGFERVYDSPVVINDFFMLSHEPMEFVPNNGVFANIFGHVHNSKVYAPFGPRHACVCVEQINYTPISFKSIYDNMCKCSEKK